MVVVASPLVVVTHRVDAWRSLPSEVEVVMSPLRPDGVVQWNEGGRPVAEVTKLAVVLAAVVVVVAVALVVVEVELVIMVTAADLSRWYSDAVVVVVVAVNATLAAVDASVELEVVPVVDVALVVYV